MICTVLLCTYITQWNVLHISFFNMKLGLATLINLYYYHYSACMYENSMVGKV